MFRQAVGDVLDFPDYDHCLLTVVDGHFSQLYVELAILQLAN